MVYLEKYCYGFQHFLIRRKYNVKSNNCFSKFYDITSSVPRGSKLGSLLYIIYANDFADLFNFAKIKIYAYDLTIYMLALIVRWTELHFKMS